MDNSLQLIEGQSKNAYKNNDISIISLNTSDGNLTDIDLRQNLDDNCKNYSILTSTFSDHICIYLFKAIYQSNLAELKSLFSEETIKPWEWTDEEGLSCLHRASFLNLDEVLKLIFEQLSLRLLSKAEIEIFVNKCSMNGSRAIHFASYRGNIDAIKILIENGADINAVNEKGLNVLHMAAQGDQPKSLIYFKEKYNLNIFSKDALGNTPLHWCCYTRSEIFLSFLLSYHEEKSEKNEINVQDNKGLTPLHLSVISEKSKIVKKLLFLGADPNLKDNQNRTAYLLALEKKKTSVAELLKSETYCMLNFNGLMQSNFEKTKRSKINMILFLLLHIVIENSTFLLILPHYGQSFISYIFLSLFFLVMFLFLILTISNPGQEVSESIENKQHRSRNLNFRKILLELVEQNISINDYCPYCVTIKNEKDRIKHCFYCKSCIKGYDHHCYWVNNCIGSENINLFFIFITVVLFNLAFQIILGLGGLFIGNYDAGTGNLVVTGTNGMYNKSNYFYFPPYFEIFKKYELYNKNIKKILCSSLLIISICFFIPVSYLWIKNVKSIWLRLKYKEKSDNDKKSKEIEEEGIFLLKSTR